MGRTTILVTGGTGSFGKKFAEIMLREYHPKRLVTLSRDELNQHDMRAARGCISRTVGYWPAPAVLNPLFSATSFQRLFGLDGAKQARLEL